MPTTTNTKRENHQERANRVAPVLIEEGGWPAKKPHGSAPFGFKESSGA